MLLHGLQLPDGLFQPVPPPLLLYQLRSLLWCVIVCENICCAVGLTRHQQQRAAWEGPLQVGTL